MKAPLPFASGFGQTVLAGVLLAASSWLPASAAVPVSEPRTAFQPYQTRLGRQRPVVSVVGDKHATEQATPATNERTLPALQYGPGRPLFDQVLASIEARYGRSTARGVALAFEYPRPVQ